MKDINGIEILIGSTVVDIDNKYLDKIQEIIENKRIV